MLNLVALRWSAGVLIRVHCPMRALPGVFFTASPAKFGRSSRGVADLAEPDLLEPDNARNTLSEELQGSGIELCGWHACDSLRKKVASLFVTASTELKGFSREVVVRLGRTDSRDDQRRLPNPPRPHPSPHRLGRLPHRCLGRRPHALLPLALRNLVPQNRRRALTSNQC